MSKEKENRKGLDKRVVLFFVFAILVVAAFLIIGLVKTCTAEHEEKEAEKAIQEQFELGMLPQQDSSLTIA